MSDTLLLNTSGQPITSFPVSVIDYKRAIKLYFLEKVTVLDWYEDWDISSPSFSMKVPATIMTKKYYKGTSKISFSRFNVHLRDEFKCQYCGTQEQYSELTMDHVKPRSHGGKATWENIVTCCKPCNTKKSDSVWKPRRKPHEPNSYQLAALRSRLPFYVKHKSWLDYIDNGVINETLSIRV